MDKREEIESILRGFERFGIQLGLERMRRLLADLGNPHERVSIVHVAGTNGKGSVCAYLSSVLTEAGYCVGCYTSPHLADWNERICVNEQPIDSKELQQLLRRIEQAIAERKARILNEESPTQFEVITAAAWLYFAQKRVDLAVMEVGLGGRLDATNVCDRALVSILTSVSLDHCQYLGTTLAAIAREKASIFKPDCPVVIGPLPTEAQTVVEQRLRDLNCLAIWPSPSQDLGEGQAEYQSPEIISGNQTSNIKHQTSISYFLPLSGAVQLTNSALAIAALQVLQHQGWEIGDRAIAAGITKTRWPGRLQHTTWQGYPLLIDGAHNPAAAQALRQYIDSESYGCDRSRTQPGISWIFGSLNTKDTTNILSALLHPQDCLYVVPVPHPDSANPESLANLARKLCPNMHHCQPYPSTIAALDTALDNLCRLDRPVSPHQTQFPIVLCGSLYLVGHFLKHSNSQAR